ncbi:MAG TPA: rod shape-determining protein RodA [Thermodesulfobacteriota bacterium]|nr:rod shape-determining protein RodA [Deltaproteobacteria bacterium]HNU70675.1 rod shape-determining protein RodA [Thermodesulfobacteriota bacterium]
MFLIDRRLILRFDWALFFVALAIVLIGIVNIYSAGYSLGPGVAMYKRQIYWLCLGIIFLFVGAFLDYAYIEQYCYALYLLTLVLLFYVLFQGKLVGGSQRWIPLGFFNLQPSELAKISLAMVLAKWFQRKYDPKGYTIRALLPPLALTAIPFSLIFLQPDLGTGLMLLAIFCSIVVFVKFRLTSFIFTLCCFISLVPFVWHLLKPYQKHRILGFLDPGLDPLGKGYQLIQSKIAIGSGQLWGQGYLKGTQSQLDFIPEKYTDFVFSVFCEEWGFLGAAILLGLYFLLFLRIATIVSHARDSFGMILGFSIASLFLWQFTINLGMVLGLLPIVGIPLPLFSYGGSSLLISMFSLGVLINIHIKRHIF